MRLVLVALLTACNSGSDGRGENNRQRVSYPDAGGATDSEVHDQGLDPADSGDEPGVDAGFVDASATDLGFRDAGPVGPGPQGFTRIEPGSYRRGDARGSPEEGPVHQVTISRAFWLQTHELTQGEWETLAGGNPSNRFNCGRSCPVESMSWWASVFVANERSRREGLSPCYQLPGNCSGSARNGDLNCSGAVGINAPGGNVLLCEGYRLPTEGEWEYAYRAGTTDQTYAGNLTEQSCGRDPVLDRIGWYCGNSNETSHPVGQKQPNNFGLYDMAGNVWELMHDDNHGYGAQAVTDPVARPEGRFRLVRGGGWSYDAERCRASTRVAWEPHNRSWAIGVRLARSILE